MRQNVDYMKIQNEIVEKITQKPAIELLAFLEIDMLDPKIAEEYILRFKYNIQKGMYLRRL